MNREKLYKSIKTDFSNDLLLKSVDKVVKDEIYYEDNIFIADVTAELARHRNQIDRIINYIRENHNVLETFE